MTDLFLLPRSSSSCAQRSRPAWDAETAELWEAHEAEGGADDPDRRIASWEARPITLAQDSASGRAFAELVDVGAGTSEADYEGKDVARKLVLTSSQPGAAAVLALGEKTAGRACPTPELAHSPVGFRLRRVKLAACGSPAPIAKRTSEGRV